MLSFLMRAGAAVSLLLLMTGLVAAQETIYEDPQGRFTVPIPTNWTIEETDDYVVLLSPESLLKLYLLVVPLAGDSAETIAATWPLVHPDFDIEIDTTLEPPSQPPVDSTLIVNYKWDGEGLYYQAVAQVVDDQVYLILFEGDLAEAQRRAAQLSIINTGYTITGSEAEDLSGVAARPVDASITAELEAYIAELMPLFKVPGAAVAIVQDGRIVYTNAFGVREQGGSEPMTVDTHMMIGSSGKSLTTTMMATLVDDGLMTWDTPVVDILPQFRMADPELTQRITVRNLVCACTGVPRRDFEFILRASQLSAEDVVESLSTFEVFTDFGEAFQYSNQMVATGGYVAAAAGGGTWGDLFDSYAALLRDRVLDPVGMPLTTIYFDDVLQRGEYATPHTLEFGFTYAPLSLDVEKMLIPVAPAGVHWSTVIDMANYILMQLNNGVSADGTRVVSEENLLVTREPQVAVSAESSYGLGWFVGEYKGLRQIEHGGNTLGFTSDMAFLPDAGLGVVVLTNAQISSGFNGAVRARLFDLVFDDVDAERDAEGIQFMLDLMAEQFAPPETLADAVNVDAVRAYVGAYTNEALGSLQIELDGSTLYVQVGDYRSSALPVMKEDEPDVVDYYITLEPPLSGMQLRLGSDDTGKQQIVLGQGVTEYTFTPVE